jgi:hypothetical protein
MLPFQEPGGKKEKWIQTDLLRKRMLEEWNSRPTPNYHHPGNLKPYNKLAKLPISKARQLFRIRCQSTRLYKHAFHTDHEPCQCGAEQSSKHTIMDCPRWAKLRRPLIEKIPGPQTWENWMFTIFREDLIFEFAKETQLLKWYEKDEDEEETDA